MNSLRRFVRALRRLTPGDLWLLARMGGWLTVLPVAMRCLSLPRLVRFFDPRAPRVRRTADRDRVIFLAKKLLSLDFFMFRPNCVKQSLVLFRFLRKDGDPVRILFGVSKEGAEIAGHCWIDLFGSPIAEEADPTQAYRIVYSFPSESTA